MTACEKCRRGPRGVEGHLDLFIHTLSSREMQFRCRTCASIWVRQHSDPSFAWEMREVAAAGSTMPMQRYDKVGAH